MALGLHKPGQGYWVRVMTACLIGLITIATAGWLWAQAAVLADVLPKASYTMGLRLIAGSPAVGQKVEIIGSEIPGSPKPVIGSAVVSAYVADQQAVTLREAVMTDKHLPSDAKFVRIAPPPATTTPAPSTAPFEASVISTIANPLIEPLYIKGGIVGVVILLGAILAYMLAGSRPGAVDFLIATDYEMKKVNWSTFREIRGSTIVVIGACVFISASLFAFDYVFQWFFQAIDVLAK